MVAKPWWHSFCNLLMYQINMVYTFNLHNVMCQLYINKTKGVGSPTESQPPSDTPWHYWAFLHSTSIPTLPPYLQLFLHTVLSLAHTRGFDSKWADTTRWLLHSSKSRCIIDIIIQTGWSFNKATTKLGVFSEHIQLSKIWDMLPPGRKAKEMT